MCILCTAAQCDDDALVQHLLEMNNSSNNVNKKVISSQFKHCNINLKNKQIKLLLVAAGK